MKWQHITAASILFQGALDQGADAGWHSRRKCLPIRINANHAADEIHKRLTCECLLSREHFIKNASKRKHVAALVYLFSSRLLWTHICSRPENYARDGSSYQSR